MNPVPLNGQIYQKQRVSGISHQSLFRPRNKFRKIPLIVIDIINYSTSICPFESGKCGKEGKISQKFEYLLDEIKNIFHSF